MSGWCVCLPLASASYRNRTLWGVSRDRQRCQILPGGCGRVHLHGQAGNPRCRDARRRNPTNRCGDPQPAAGGSASESDEWKAGSSAAVIKGTPTPSNTASMATRLRSPHARANDRPGSTPSSSASPRVSRLATASSLTQWVDRKVSPPPKKRITAMIIRIDFDSRGCGSTPRNRTGQRINCGDDVFIQSLARVRPGISHAALHPSPEISMGFIPGVRGGSRWICTPRSERIFPIEVHLWVPRLPMMGMSNIQRNALSCVRV